MKRSSRENAIVALICTERQEGAFYIDGWSLADVADLHVTTVVCAADESESLGVL